MKAITPLHTVDPMTAQSADLFGSPKQSVSDNDNILYKDFRLTLTPRYRIVWRDISCCYIAILLLSVLLISIQSHYPSAFYVTIPCGAFLLAYASAAFPLFWHEASHFNIAPDRHINDVLANILIGPLFLGNIANYRAIHLDHHRYHGETNDTENSYFEALNLRYIIESVAGIKVLRTILYRHNTLYEKKRKPIVTTAAIVGKIIGLCTHISIIVSSIYFEHWQFAITWIIAYVSIFPLLLTLRQLLEHRSSKANKYIDYAQERHGATNRLFGDGPIANTFGAAGFNRHLIHHWDASVSYTRLAELERYLLNSRYGNQIENAQTTYLKTFRELYNA